MALAGPQSLPTEVPGGAGPVRATPYRMRNGHVREDVAASLPLCVAVV